MPTADLQELARKYFAAYVTKERWVVDGLLSDNFTFTSPYDDRIGRAAYFEKCWPNSAKIRTIAVEKLCGQGAEIFVRYRLELFGGAAFRNTELLRFDGDRIVDIEVYFGRTIKDGPRQ
jgi:hypothetical protein